MSESRTNGAGGQGDGHAGRSGFRTLGTLVYNVTVEL